MGVSPRTCFRMVPRPTSSSFLLLVLLLFSLLLPTLGASIGSESLAVSGHTSSLDSLPMVRKKRFVDLSFLSPLNLVTVDFGGVRIRPTNLILARLQLSVATDYHRNTLLSCT